MNIVIFEDDDIKYKVIYDHILSLDVHPSTIHRMSTTAEFARVGNMRIDLCILDLRLPSVSGADTRSAGVELLQMLEYSGKTRVPTLAITSYMEEADQVRDQFAARGCLIYDFARQDLWKQAAEIFLSQARERRLYDFIIFAALDKERRGYRSDPRIKISSTVRFGFDHWDCQLGEAQGTIILLPKMGLVDASITVARALELYQPKLVAMSGICAGLPDKTKLGQLLIPNVCWEYQSGKWMDEVFEPEPYQSKLLDGVELELKKMLEAKNLVRQLEADFDGSFRPSEVSTPSLSVFSTGSAVVASEKWLEIIKNQHRRVSGIDMEMFGLYRASEKEARSIKFFGAKVVVDHGNNAKDDKLHEYGCHISARFTVTAIQQMLGQRTD